MTIRTRFAPSPTGYLHIGGVRTALFNWLLARRLGGQFILRIDDTDADRNRPEALQPILDGFRWLGIDWDEGPEVGGPYGPYFQSQRNQLYIDAAMKLLETGHAYPDYVPKEQLDAERKAAEAAKKPYIHRGPHRDTPTAECVRLYKEKPTTLRLKVPLGRTLAIEDAIRDHVEWQSDLIGDPVILRPDGRALYNFATVIDDAAMKITHVIRSAEHLTNTAVQVVAFEALGYSLPVFAHVPVVNWKGKKMSKRALPPLSDEEGTKLRLLGWSDAEIAARTDLNIATVAYYREMGYLPAAIVNYLGRLGWSLDDHSEFIPLVQMQTNFSLERVNKAPGEFDPKKLYWLQDEYMRLLPFAEKLAGCTRFLVRAGLLTEPVDAANRQKLEHVITASGDRIKLFSDILVYASPFFRTDPEFDAGAVKKRLQKEGVPELLRAFADILATAEPFEVGPLEAKLNAFCQERGLKSGDLIHALRVSTTGVAVGPGVFDCLAILGRDETLRRIKLALGKFCG
jgi:glutamyl-tRNA synthetase